MIMSGLSHKKKDGRERRFSKRQMLWDILPGGGYYPFGLSEKKGEVLHRLADFPALERLCREDLERCGESDPAAGFRLMKLGAMAAQHGDLDSSRIRLDKALELMRRTGDSENAFVCRTALVNVSVLQCRFSEAELAAAEMASEAESAGNLKALASVLNLQGLAAMKQGQHRQALWFFGRKLELARSLGLMVDQAMAMGNIGQVYLEQKRFSEAATVIRESLDLCRRIGDLYSAYCVLYTLGEAYQGQGDLGEAERCFREDLEMARQLGDGPGEQDILRIIAELQGKNAGS